MYNDDNAKITLFELFWDIFHTQLHTLDLLGLNTLLWLARECHDYEKGLLLIHYLKKSGGANHTNMDILSRSLYITNYLSRNIVIPMKESMDSLGEAMKKSIRTESAQAQTLDDETEGALTRMRMQSARFPTMTIERIEGIISILKRGHKASRVGDLRKIKRWEWKIFYPELSDQDRDFIFRMIRIPVFIMEQLPWQENKASLLGRGMVMGGIVKGKTGENVFYSKA